MKDKKIEKFRIEYETKIKKYRDRYYEKIQSKEYKYTGHKINYNAISITITILVATLVLLLARNFIGDIIALLIAIISTIITRYIIKENDNLQNNDFTRAIRKAGYFTIEAYEEKLSEYLTGPCGVYKTELEELKRVYNIDDDTTILYAQNNDRYYAWNNKDKSILYLLNTKITEKPEVRQYPMDKIRYYRLDKTQKVVIIKTDGEDHYFLPKSYEEIEILIPGKEFHKSQTFEPEKYINDFELYIHKVKTKMEEREKSCTKKKTIAKNTAIATILIMITTSILEHFIPAIEIFGVIARIAIIIPFINNLNRYYREKFRIPKNEYEIIKALNEDRENINRFHELKVSLAIDNTSDVIYTKEGQQYLAWTKNGYFHLFLNIIYFNVVYIVVKTQDVEYYKKEEKECIVKLKDRTLTFKPCAEEVFSRILANKDYYWLKNIKK